MRREGKAEGGGLRVLLTSQLAKGANFWAVPYMYGRHGKPPSQANTYGKP
jgi:hypothetical protein